MRDEELPHDPNNSDNPPVEAPPGADPLLWRLAYSVYETHRSRADGFCACRDFWPCEHARLAGDHLRMAYAIDPSLPEPTPVNTAYPISRAVLRLTNGCRVYPVNRITSRPSRQRRRTTR
jgi:hypothetical protein